MAGNRIFFLRPCTCQQYPGWLNLEEKPKFAEFASLGTRITGARSEYKTIIYCLEKLVGSSDDKLRDFIALDGNCFYISALANDELWQGANKKERNELKEVLKEEEISPFYALLLMDGDKMGALLQTYSADQAAISQAISTFSHQVPEVINSNNGIAIFAGGEDVLAFLPYG